MQRRVRTREQIAGVIAVFRKHGDADSAPRRLRRSLRHLRHCVCRLEQALARAPTGREIAAEMQLTPAQYHRLVQDPDAHKPLDLHSAELQDMRCQDAAAQADPLYYLLEQCTRRQLSAAVSKLPKRERRMLMLRLNRGLELRRIATFDTVSCHGSLTSAARVEDPA